MMEDNSIWGEHPAISFAIPLYNKREFFLEVINSICEACKSSLVSFEIVLVDNDSNDLERSVDDLLSGHKYIKYIQTYSLPKTVSVSENWALTLRLCTGRFIKLQLADDKLTNFDLGALLDFLDKNPRLDYVIGKTKPVFISRYMLPGDIKAASDYFENVNSSRKALLNLPTHKDRIEYLFHNDFFYGANILGDINSLIFKRDALPVVLASTNIGYPSASSWMDWEMLLFSSILLSGVFWDEYISEYSYNPTSNSNLALADPFARELQFDIPRRRALFAFLIDPAFKLHISSQLESQFVQRLVSKALSEIQQHYPAAFSRFCICYLGELIQSLPRQILFSTAFCFRRFCKRLASSRQALKTNR